MYNSAMRSSYSDDYTRRKAIIRAEQPALMTDRNAYVNFLEVQLERVSSACMSVQAYDQKFTDMQAMIVGLEQRSSSTTRLVSLSQQCIEELRSNVFAEIEKQSQRSTAMHVELQRSVQILNGKLNTVEEGLHSLSSLPMKMTSLEREIARLNLAIQSVDDMTKKSFKDMDKRVDPVESNVADALQSITSLQAASSRMGLDVSELERRQSNALMTLENRTAELMSNDRDEVARKLQSLSNKVSFEFENMDKSHTSREAKMMSAIRADFRGAQDEMHSIRSALESLVKSSAGCLETAFKTDMEDLRALTDSKCDELNAFVQAVKESHEDSVRDNAQSLNELAGSIQGLAGVQSETTEALEHLRAALSDPSANVLVSEEAQVDNEIAKIMGALSSARASGGGGSSGNGGGAASVQRREVTPGAAVRLAPRTNQQQAAAPSGSVQNGGAESQDRVREQKSAAGAAAGPIRQQQATTPAAAEDVPLTSSDWLEKVSQSMPAAPAAAAVTTVEDAVSEEQRLFRQFMAMYKKDQQALKAQLDAVSGSGAGAADTTSAGQEANNSLDISDTEDEHEPAAAPRPSKAGAVASAPSSTGTTPSGRPRKPAPSAPREELVMSSSQARYMQPKPTPPWVPAKVPPLLLAVPHVALPFELCSHFSLFLFCST
jgi:hypothetical protein